MRILLALLGDLRAAGRRRDTLPFYEPVGEKFFALQVRGFLDQRGSFGSLRGRLNRRVLPKETETRR